MNQLIKQHPASFRDPSGFIYSKDGTIYRFVSTSYQSHFKLLESSGLSADLIKKKLLLPYAGLQENHTNRPDWHITLQPRPLPFLSFAWEWSFSQLKDAAITTLAVCKAALQKGMILKDATPSNIQFVEGKAMLIDTLSFETYVEGEAWVAYRQFCECFLNPLLLARYCGLEVHRLSLSYPDGVPASVTAPLLPLRTKLKPSVYLHVHLHANMVGKTTSNAATKKVSKKNIEQILQHLEDCINGLTLTPKTTTWNNYYGETILSNEYLHSKKELISSLLTGIDYTSVIDLGANEGEFSLLCKKESLVVATDFDSACIDSFYKRLRKEKQTHILPLVIDLTYPSPAMGWQNIERVAFFKRQSFDLCLALALIHHLAVAKNLRFEQLADFFADICTQLIIEFVPKTDPKVVGMLQWRQDIFDQYTPENFEHAFEQHFACKVKKPVHDSERTIYYYYKK
jgi:hypothetical protein